ncbi:MAG: RNA polymerase sigma factor, partial [Gammaproteobacteria bacterium]
SRAPVLDRVPEDLPLDAPSPLQQAIGREAFEAYEAALDRLPSRQQEAVVLRIEMGFTHQEVAEALELPSANAARMLVARALVGLAEVMDGRA